MSRPRESWWYSPRKGVYVGKGLSEIRTPRQRSATAGHVRVLSLQTTEGRTFAAIAISMLLLGTAALLVHRRRP
jgi:hypothetical protein